MPEELQIQFNNFTIGRNKNENLVSKWVKDWASLVAQLVKNLPAVRETQVRSLGWEDPWRRKWQPTLVFLPGKSHGQRSLVGCSPWGRKELGITE